MQAIILKMIIEVVLKYYSSEKILELADALIDKIEDSVEESETKIDDAIVLPILRQIRATFNIPDND